ncbi:MAG: hypothetical protein JO224_00185 [Pelomonas sp.]|nr:hypothetical protein [Roseateles sp.]
MTALAQRACIVHSSGSQSLQPSGVAAMPVPERLQGVHDRAPEAAADAQAR